MYPQKLTNTSRTHRALKNTQISTGFVAAANDYSMAELNITHGHATG